MTEFSVISDLHLDFGSGPHVRFPESDVLLIAGDVIESKILQEKYTDARARGERKAFHRFCEAAVKDRQAVYAISGNHEPYGSDITESHDIMREAYTKHGIIYLDNETVIEQDYEIWGGTLWTSFDGGNGVFMERAENYMNDYARITHKDEMLKPYDVLQIHNDYLVELERFLDTPSDLPKIVMSHHGPSYKSVDPKFINDYLTNPSYVNDYDHLVEKADLWVHGHTHSSHWYTIGKCRVMCNPYGYHGYETKTGKINIGMTWSN